MAAEVVAGFLIVALVGGAASARIPGSLSLLEPSFTCNLGELSCGATCSFIMVCVGDGEYAPVECPPGTLCDYRTLKCSTELQACLKPESFTCSGKVGGRFPHPLNCHKYIDCPNPIPSPAVEGNIQTCNPSNSSFNALSGVCDLTPEHRVCVETPVPACKVEMQSGPLAENPNMYYVCRSEEGVLKPFLARCDGEDEVYHDGVCMQVATTIVPETTPFVPCASPGDSRADPMDCTKYYLCLQDGREIHISCAEYQHYNHVDVAFYRCLDGRCTSPQNNI